MSFKGFLKANTAATIKLGPFVDSTDGDTAETALTIAQADVRLSKNGGDFAQKNESSSATHDELGYYDVDLDTTDINTYGSLRVVVKESGALIVDNSYEVLAEPVYDSLFPSASGNPLPVFGIIDWGTAQASASGTLVHRSGLNLANDIINGATEFIYGGTGAGQSRGVYDFTNSNDTANISPDWATTPSTDSTYVTFASAPAQTNSSGIPQVNTIEISGSSTAADNLEVVYDTDFATNYSTSNDKWQVEADLTSISGDGTAADNLESAFDGTGYDVGGIDVSELNAIVDDLINGGRLDLLIDAIKAVIDNLPDSGALSSLATASAVSTIDSNVGTMVSGIIEGAAETGTLSTTQATTDLTGYADDQLIGRIITWTSGDCEGEQTDITDYASTNGTITFTALTTAPGDGDTFKIT